MAKNKLKKLKARAEDQEMPDFDPPQLTPIQKQLQTIREEVTLKAGRKLVIELDKEHMDIGIIAELSKITGHAYY